MYDEPCKQNEMRRLILLFIFSIIIFLTIILVGTIGYIYLFDLTWIDAFYNASLVLTAISVEVNPETIEQKLFIIIYSLISVILFLSIASGVINKLFDAFIDTNDY